MAYPYPWGFRCKKPTAESPFQFLADNFPRISRWKLVLWFLAAIGCPLLADSGNWRTTTHLFESQWEAYSRYWYNSGKPNSAISWLASRYQLFAAGAPLIWISWIFWLKPLKPVFLRFKGQVPSKIKKKIFAVQCERKSFQFILLSTPVSFRWTVSLRPSWTLWSSDFDNMYIWKLLYFM